MVQEDEFDPDQTMVIEPDFIEPPVAQPVQVGPSMRQHLQSLYGLDATWRAWEQRDGVAALLQLDRDVVLALRTGLGKTAIAILPSMVENGYTVIITPLTALKEDWMRRLDAMKVPYELFKGVQSERLQGKANIILVSADIAKFDHWKQCLAELNTKRPVLRMVVDEVHYYFTDQDFRKDALSDAFELRHFPTQMVLMSGTIPPPAESYLEKQFVLHRPVTLRTHSARSELKYTRTMPMADLEGGIKTLIEFLANSNLCTDSADRYLIFTPSLADGYVIAERLGVEFYHANSTDNPISDDRRAQIYGRWLSGRHLGLVATNALAAGNDYAHVRLTVHLGSPHDMVTFVQQTGRAGRDGKHATCLLIPSKAMPGSEDRLGLKGYQAMHSYCYGSRLLRYPNACLRYQTTLFIDGKGMTCLDWAGFGRCDVCLKRKTP